MANELVMDGETLEEICREVCTTSGRGKPDHPKLAADVVRTVKHMRALYDGSMTFRGLVADLKLDIRMAEQASQSQPSEIKFGVTSSSSVSTSVAPAPSPGGAEAAFRCRECSAPVDRDGGYTAPVVLPASTGGHAPYSWRGDDEVDRLTNLLIDAEGGALMSLAWHECRINLLDYVVSRASSVSGAAPPDRAGLCLPDAPSLHCTGCLYCRPSAITAAGGAATTAEGGEA